MKTTNATTSPPVEVSPEEKTGYPAPSILDTSLPSDPTSDRIEASNERSIEVGAYRTLTVRSQVNLRWTARSGVG
jgi:hypothetical protein